MLVNIKNMKRGNKYEFKQVGEDESCGVHGRPP